VAIPETTAFPQNVPDTDTMEQWRAKTDYIVKRINSLYNASANLQVGGNISLGGDITLLDTKNLFFVDSSTYLKAESGGISFGSGSQERIRLLSNGLLGLNITTPSEVLSLNGRISFENDTYDKMAMLSLEEAGSGNGRLLFWTRVGGSHTEKMRIDENGRVGINTTSPGSMLDVRRNGSVLPTSGTDTSNVMLRTTNTNSNEMLLVGHYNVSPFGAYIQSCDSTDISQSYPLALNPNGGDVGIGTTDPTSLLAGTKGLSLFDATSAGLSIGNTDNKWLFYNDGNDLEIYNFDAGEDKFRLTSAGNMEILTGDVHLNGGVLRAYNPALSVQTYVFHSGTQGVLGSETELAFQTNSNTRLIIDTSGRIIASTESINVTNGLSLVSYGVGNPTAVNYERARLTHSGASGAKLLVEAQGTGTVRDFAISMNGVDSLFVTSDGNIGAGATPVNERLEIDGAIKIGTNTGNENGTIRYTGSDIEGRIGGAWVSLSTPPDFDVWTDTGTLIYPNNLSRDVGIGTNAPTARLTVDGPSGNPTPLARFIGNSSNDYLDIGVDSTNRQAWIRSVRTGSENDLILQQYGGGVAINSNVTNLASLSVGKDNTSLASPNLLLISESNQDANIRFSDNLTKTYTMGLDEDVNYFSICDGSTLGTNARLTIRDTGNVVIHGDAELFSDALINGVLTSTPASDTANFVVGTNSGSNTRWLQGIIAGDAFSFLYDSSGTKRVGFDAKSTGYNYLHRPLQVGGADDLPTSQLSVAGGAVVTGLVQGNQFVSGASSVRSGFNWQINSTNAGSYLLFTNTITGNGASDGGSIGMYGKDLSLVNLESGNLIFGTAGSERARINNTGELRLQNLNASEVMVSDASKNVVSSGVSSSLLSGFDGRITTLEGNPVWSIASGSDIYYNSGAVAIGKNTIESGSTLDVNGLIQTSQLSVAGGAVVTGLVQGNQFVSGASSVRSGFSWQINSTNTGSFLLFTNTTTGNTNTDGGFIGMDGNDLSIVNLETANLIFNTAGSERARINNTGELRLQNLTASEVMVSDASKNVVSSGVSSTLLSGFDGRITTLEGNPVWSIASGSDIYYNAGAVAIGKNTIESGSTLDVDGLIQSSTGIITQDGTSFGFGDATFNRDVLTGYLSGFNSHQIDLGGSAYWDRLNLTVPIVGGLNLRDSDNTSTAKLESVDVNDGWGMNFDSLETEVGGIVQENLIEYYGAYYRKEPMNGLVEVRWAETATVSSARTQSDNFRLFSFDLPAKSIETPFATNGEVIVVHYKINCAFVNEDGFGGVRYTAQTGEIILVWNNNSGTWGTAIDVIKSNPASYGALNGVYLDVGSTTYVNVRFAEVPASGSIEFDFHVDVKITRSNGEVIDNFIKVMQFE
jgi:hypothetical protein